MIKFLLIVTFSAGYSGMVMGDYSTMERCMEVAAEAYNTQETRPGHGHIAFFTCVKIDARDQ